jgi:hypothetical protein
MKERRSNELSIVDMGSEFWKCEYTTAKLVLVTTS